MSDSLIIFGKTYNDVVGIKATDSNNNEITYVTGGGGNNSTSASKKDVNFYDYDGTCLYSYTTNEFAALESMPTNPDHTSDGLTSQGWNWTLVDAKTYVTAYGKLNIGQMYITTDGKTHVHIHLEQGRTSPILGVCPNGTVDVDWGDGTTHDTLTGTSTSSVKWTPTHNYAAPGDYVIKLTVNEGDSMGLNYNSVYIGLLTYKSSEDDRNYIYRSSIKEIYVGSGLTDINTYAFKNLTTLQFITLPNTMLSIGNAAFDYCFSLSSLTIPSSVTSINNNAFSNCYNLSSVTIPNSVTSIGNSAFNTCYSLSSVTIPNSVTSIGTSAFKQCGSLNYVSLSNAMTDIKESTFENCYSLMNVTIPNGITSIGKKAFCFCKSLTCITIPNSVTSIGESAFSYCECLVSVSLPNTITSIDQKAFELCYNIFDITIPTSITSINFGVYNSIRNLSKITIPSSVTTIASQAFQNFFGLSELHFNPLIPPTVSSGAFSNIPKDCKIYVPTGSLSAYTSASNYPSSSTYTYIEE